jgi:hypothetical protein
MQLMHTIFYFIHIPLAYPKNIFDAINCFFDNEIANTRFSSNKLNFGLEFDKCNLDVSFSSNNIEKNCQLFDTLHAYYATLSKKRFSPETTLNTIF